ncbi:unnamed protein product [Allacma fusca]|uniref:MYND-type domain-containing protein n=1 Tax=Allacma fusca TaxID=39272 RepID=A0A8J2NSZ1_9HEXA|nr:unnamed protein product [Allacma fusca]
MENPLGLAHIGINIIITIMDIDAVMNTRGNLLGLKKRSNSAVKMVNENRVTGPCRVCGTSTSRTCLRCQTVFYCTYNHETSDVGHEKSCQKPLYRRKDSENDSGVFVAKQNLSPGQIIFTEYPFICGPADRVEGDGRSRTCLGCCTKLSKKNQDQKCRKCGWPVCSKTCEASPQHSQYECKYFQENNIHFPDSTASFRCRYFLYRGVMMLRALLTKKREAGAFQEFVNLPSRRNPDPETFKHTNTHDTVVLKLLRETFRISNTLLPENFDTAKEELSTLLDHLSMYGFAKEITNPSQNNKRGFLNGVYTTAARIKRSCLPNVTWSIGPGPNFVLTVMAAKTILKNEELHMAYSTELHHLETFRRQQHVLNFVGSPCKCPRCKDPTEMGTFYSAVKCSECSDGYLVPNNPLSTKSMWQCLNEACQQQIRYAKISQKISKLTLKCDSVIKKSSEISGAEELEELVLEIRTKTYLHPNHFIIVRLVWEIVKRQFLDLHSLDWSALNSFLAHCDYLLNIENAFTPVFSFGRALLYFFIGRAFFKQYEFLETVFSYKDASQILDKIMDLYDGARKYFLAVHKDRPIVRTVHEDMKYIVSVINNIQRVK